MFYVCSILGLQSFVFVNMLPSKPCEVMNNVPVNWRFRLVSAPRTAPAAHLHLKAIAAPLK